MLALDFDVEQKNKKNILLFDVMSKFCLIKIIIAIHPVGLFPRLGTSDNEKHYFLQPCACVLGS